MEEQIKSENQLDQTPKKEWITPEWDLIEINSGKYASRFESTNGRLS